MKKTLKIKHSDGITPISVTGNLINGTFTGEYKFQGMTYGVEFPYELKPAAGCKR